MNQENTQLNKIWTRLLGHLNGIFALQPINPDEYMSLYNAISRYFASLEYNDHFLAEKTKKIPAQTENDQKEKILPGGDLYYNSREFFRNHLEKIAENKENLEGEDFLRFYAKTWEKYQFSSTVAHGLLAVVNSTWVDRQRREGAQHIHEIGTTAMHIWQDVFFKESNHSLIQTCLNLINNERTGLQIDSSLIRQVVQSYVSAGFKRSAGDKKQTVEQTLATYVEYFEKLFLEETEQFYRSEVNQLVETSSIIDYVRKVNQRIEQEETRARTVLHPTTLDKIKSLLEQIFIANQIQRMQEELKSLLLNEKIEEIRLVFNLVNRIPKGNEPIQGVLHDFSKQEALNAINRISSIANKDPKVYVETIIEVYLRFRNIVQQGFCSHADYSNALDRAFSSVVNDNAVTQAAGKSTRTAELLAAYCDILLKKGNKLDVVNIEEKFDQIMMIFNYVEDKDAFQKFYGKRLAKRLVGQLSASDDYEELMISKLKQACGFEYTSRLQRMFQDISLSKNLIDEYQKYCQDKNVQDIVDIYVMVLSSNSWPFSSPSTFNLPIELDRTFASFTNYYTRKFTGRKLDWLHQHSKGEVQLLYTKPKYTLQVSMYQMAILLLFNSFNNLQVEEIQQKTAIEIELFLQVLLTLIRSGVLKCLQIDSSRINDEYSEKNFQGDYSIQVDESYKSKKVKVNLNVPLKSVEQKESEKDDKQINEDRKMVIQAAVVRIMKARKSLKHALLMQEVIEQLKSRFKPKIEMIKKNIEILIEKEYLERQPTERDLLKYLA